MRRDTIVVNSLLVGIATVALAWPAAAQITAPGGPQPSGDRSVAPGAATDGEIVVTATRKAELLSRVPISVSAFSNAKLEVLGIKSFAEVQRFTPGVQFDPERKDIAIRGVSSQAGTGTTGIYIDDTPIQVRALGLNANNTAPVVFDLDRVEVLRGPQGTLFGAGSEGGTVRYITPQPGLDSYTGYARAETSFTQKGAPSYEAGAALGGPIVTDILGFRASAYYRREGGYIDRVDYQTLAPVERNANHAETLALRAALAWKPVDAVTITPSIFHQDRTQRQNDRYWVGISDPNHGRFLNGTPDRQADKDRFTLASLKIEARLGGVTLTSDGSYFRRNEAVNGYSGTLYNLSLFQQLLTNANADGTTGQNFNLDPYTNATQATSAAGYPLLTATGIALPQFPNYVAQVNIANRQENFTQEVRLQSADADGRFSWVAGVFFQSSRQTSVEEINDPLLPQLVPALFGGTFLDFTEGIPLLPNGDSYINSTTGKDRQIALFADATFALTPQLKINAGVRYAWTKYSFVNFSDGAQNIGFRSGNGGKSETPFTPKVSVNYQATPDNLFYGTVAKGFRIGGANPPIPLSLCAADIAKLGGVPSTYASDSVWSYELGSKNKLFGRKLSFSGSAYYLEWKNIQQASYLTSCGFQYTGNFGTVHSKGFDAQFQWLAAKGLNLDLAVGYTSARYAKTTASLGSGNLSTQGDTVPGVAPWTVTAGAQYDFQVGSHNAFVRGDYEFRSRNPYLPPIQNPLSAVSDLALVNDPATAQVSLRTGITVHGVSAEAFVNNLANVHPQLGLAHEDQYTLLFEAQTIRPRTFGLSLSYRY